MSEPDTLICPKCARPTPPGADYCPECSAPLTAHSVYDPFDTIKTVGYVYREGSQRPRAPIVVVGIVMLLGPLFCFSTYGLMIGAVELYRRPHQFGWWGIPLFGLMGILAYISGAILWRTFSNFENRGAATDAMPANEADVDDENDEDWYDEAEAAGRPEDDSVDDAKSDGKDRR